MSDIPASAVASLRARTGVSILECKKALEESGGNEEQAIEILRKRGAAQAVKKAARDQSEGLVFCAAEGGKVALVQLKCETDFVARNEDFQALGQDLAQLALREGADAAKGASEQIAAAVQKLGENISIGDVAVVEGSTVGYYLHTNGKIGVAIALNGGSPEIAKDVAMHAAAMNPAYVSPEDVPAEAVAKEKEIWTEQLAKEGKPAQIVEKIMLGKEKKFREENALIKQAFVKNPEQTISQYLGGATIARYVRISV
ncbi:MAG: translation elongation factor Ts [Candidatus Peribacteraceae bacterium]|nr:translation elongation factor Ts [Candidatus Peribacteraceae bacterium]